MNRKNTMKDWLEREKKINDKKKYFNKVTVSKKVKTIANFNEDAPDQVQMPRSYYEYLEKGCEAARRAGLYKAKIFDENGRVIGLQG